MDTAQGLSVVPAAAASRVMPEPFVSFLLNVIPCAINRNFTWNEETKHSLSLDLKCKLKGLAVYFRHIRTKHLQRKKDMADLLFANLFLAMDGDRTLMTQVQLFNQSFASRLAAQRKHPPTPPPVASPYPLLQPARMLQPYNAASNTTRVTTPAKKPVLTPTGSSTANAAMNAHKKREALAALSQQFSPPANSAHMNAVSPAAAKAHKKHKPSHARFNQFSPPANSIVTDGIINPVAANDLTLTQPARETVPDSVGSASGQARSSNNQDNVILSELRSMGFTSEEEMLSSIRRCRQPQTNGSIPTINSQTVMMDIITSREEQEEANKMDAARRASELSRKSESARLRRVLARQRTAACWASTWDQWQSSSKVRVVSPHVNDDDTEGYVFFPHSWILASRNMRKKWEKMLRKSKFNEQRSENNSDDADLKSLFIELLHLEKKARQWYGASLPEAYFLQHVIPTLVSATSPESCLRLEVGFLKEHMYQLDRQVNGVPKVFRDYHDNNSSNNWDAAVATSNSDDTVCMMGSRQVEATEHHEVIEIL